VGIRYVRGVCLGEGIRFGVSALVWVSIDKVQMWIQIQIGGQGSPQFSIFIQFFLNRIIYCKVQCYIT